MPEENSKATMWAEMAPDIYGGPDFDKQVPRWTCRADGDRGGEDHEFVLDLAARNFPPGTKITITEPVCPDCGELREPHLSKPEPTLIYHGPCRCGFNWDAWVEDKYS